MDMYTRAKNSFLKFSKFPYRDYQEDIIEFAHKSTKRFTVIEAPTGIGKTLCGMVLGRLFGSSIYCVHSKTLQTQVSDDFTGIPILWGRANYPCALFEDMTADACGGSAKTCETIDECEYHKAKERAATSNLAVLNYHYYLTEVNYVGRFSGRECLVVDEADALESVLASFIGINLSHAAIREFGINAPDYKTTSSVHALDAWKSWALETRDSMLLRYNELERFVGKNEIKTTAQIEAIKKMNQISSGMSKLKKFHDYVDVSWLYEEKDNKYGKSMHFNPTWISPALANDCIWKHAKRFVLMSATFPYLPILAKLLGIKQDEIAYRQYPSVFPAENRQVKYSIAGNLVYKEMKTEIPKVMTRVKEIINDTKHKGEKGLIHTVSYKLAEEIMKIKDKRLVSHLGDTDRAAVIEHFKSSDKPLILVSPSMDRGISLDDDLCRFIIWLKAPFLSLADKMVAARLYGSGHLGNMWYKSMMLLSIVQGCGRGVRSDTDYSTTYLLDEQIRKAMIDNPNMVPKWFREAIW